MRKDRIIQVKVTTPISNDIVERLKTAFKAVAELMILPEYIEVSEELVTKQGN